MKKFLSILLAFVMLFSMALPAFAGGEETAILSGSDSGVDFLSMIADAISGFFDDIVNFFKDLFGLNDNAGYYTITYQDSDGYVYGTANYPAGAEIAAPSIPHKDGYVFMNWYPAIPDEMPERDIIVTAQWAVDAN